MKNKDIFYLHFQEKFFNPGEIIKSTDTYECKVLEKPKRKWYQILFQYITFGIYKARYLYKIEIINLFK